MRASVLATAIAGLLLISCSVQASELFLVDLETGEPRSLIKEDGRFFGSPHWSPDGKSIAFDTWGRGEDGQDAKIGIYNMESGEWRIIGVGAMPKFSPDSKQLVCHVYSPSQIVVLNVDGTGREAIFDQWGAPWWDREGRAIYTCNSRGGIHKFDLRTGQQQEVAAHGTSVHWGYSVSPTGNGFAFASYNNSMGIALADESGTFHTDWKWPHFTSQYCCWSPDGKRIVAERRVGTDETKFKDLVFLDPYSDQEPETVPGSGTRWHGWGPSWSPDGKTIVCGGRSRIADP